jgi:hypothetical protein
MKKIEYKGWKNCYQLSNDIVNLIVTTDIGPRIIWFGFANKDNIFKEYSKQIGTNAGNKWANYGGHRLWHAPESNPRTYYPDNEPVEIENYNSFIRLTQKVEKTTGIQKEIDIQLSKNKANVKIIHRLINKGLWAVRLAPWALSVMKQSGIAIIPLPPRGKHQDNLLPTNTISLWAYTNMSDSRWYWGNKYIMLKQNCNAIFPQKIGIMVTDGWCGYAVDNKLFVKTFAYLQNRQYPDFGCSVETFTDSEMLEVETLAPLTELEPETSVEHIENWYLFDNVPMPNCDDDIDMYIMPKIKEAKQNSIE